MPVRHSKSLLFAGLLALWPLLCPAQTAQGLCLKGDASFRRADFDVASAAYSAAIAVDSRYARAYLGLGRVELIQFHRSAARELTARAFGLDPHDPDIIRAYTEFATDPKSRETLLRNLVVLTRTSDRPTAESALNQLVMERRLHGMVRGRLAGEYRDYTIPLRTYQPGARVPGAESAGLIAPVVLNGGKTLWLVLDSGASGITVSARAARKLDLESLSEIRIGGFGGGAVSGVVALARSVRIGELVLEDCAVGVTQDSLAEGADGVLGMDTFEAFQIQLDARARSLRLSPFDSGPPIEGPLGHWMAYDRSTQAATPSHAYGIRHFLMLKAHVQGGKAGLFLVDTGSSVTSVARSTASPTVGFPVEMPMHGAAGVVRASRISPIVVEVGGRLLGDAQPVSLDLDDISQRQGVQISGVLGYSVLSRSTVTFNYRDGLVELGPDR